MSFVNCASLAEFNANTPDEFKAAIGNSIDDTREVLLNEWIPDCADIIRSGLHEGMTHKVLVIAMTHVIIQKKNN